MPWFFIEEEAKQNNLILSGENARHISKSLRMRTGEELTLVTPAGEQLDCEIDEIGEMVSVTVRSRKPCENEPHTRVTLYQALPKGDKMELIVQKCVELGVAKIVPVISARCISRPDEKALRKKQIRWQKIAREAAQQSRRGLVPEVAPALSFSEAVGDSRNNDSNIIFYELGGESVRALLKERPETVGVFIGSEGGFEASEVEAVLGAGGFAATLGPRILRAETAPLAALSIIMYENGEFDSPSKTAKQFRSDLNRR